MGHCVNWVVGKRYKTLVSQVSADVIAHAISSHLSSQTSFISFSPSLSLCLQTWTTLPVTFPWQKYEFFTELDWQESKMIVCFDKSFLQMNILQMSRFFLQRNKFESFPLSHLFCLFMPVSYGQMACVED